LRYNTEVDESSVDLDASSRSARRIIAVGGGKGGAGKSLLAANIAIYLATLGKRVVLLDADLGGANLHSFVGVERPRVTIGDLFEKRVNRIEDVVVETAISGLGLVSGEGDPSWIANPRPAQKMRLLHQVQELSVDYLVVDLGPGTSLNALDFFLVADVGILVVIPEPTSVENFFRFLKSAFLRQLRRAHADRVLALAKEGDHVFEGGIPAPYDLYEAARDADPVTAEKVLNEISRFRPRLVVNQVRSRGDLDLGPSLVSTCRRRLGVGVDYLGHLDFDDAVLNAVRKRRPLFVEQPDSPAANAIERIVRRLVATENDKPVPAQVRALEELTHYDVLEIDPAATDEEIRRAYRRVRDVYGVDSLATCGLYGRDRLAGLHLRFEEAYEVLMEAERRRAYDLNLFGDEPQRRRAASQPAAPLSSSGPLAILEVRPSGPTSITAPEPSAPVAAPAQPEVPPRPPEPVLSAETEFTGALLKQVREARGIDLHTIAARTKIAIGHLRALEDERYEIMPATVYVRGFLVEVARFLKLDAKRVTQTYLARLKPHRADPG
jgi:flagellar biosynthesis protein FlhG